MKGFKFPQKGSSVKKPSKFEIPVGKVNFYEVHPFFSFKHYHIKHNKYTFNRFEKNDFHTLVENIHKMSQYTWKEILQVNKKFFHAHPVNWNDTNAKEGFVHLNPELRGYPVYQFAISHKGRIFGFINNHNVFEIVWVDRDHDISPNE